MGAARPAQRLRAALIEVADREVRLESSEPEASQESACVCSPDPVRLPRAPRQKSVMVVRR
jgi:hypothetical protein